MNTAIKPIETVYNGYRFRSRLEARWAVFFEKVKMKYSYEAEGFSLNGMKYLPDFFLPELECYVEVKPLFPSEQEKEKVIRLCIASQKAVIILSGDTWPDSTNWYFVPINPLAGAKELVKKWEQEMRLLWLTSSHFILSGDDDSLICGADMERKYTWGHTYFRECQKCKRVLLTGLESSMCTCNDGEWEGKSPRLIAAYTAARQARFEYGEKG